MLTWDILTHKVAPHSLKERMIGGFVWNTFGAVVSRVFSLFTSIVVARLLGKEGFGEIAVVQSTVSLFGTFGGLGLSLAATKFIAEFRETNPAKAGRILTIVHILSLGGGLLFTAILVLSSPWLADNALAAPGLSSSLQLGSILLLFGVINGAQTGALIGFEAFGSNAKVNISSAVASLPISWILVKKMGVQGGILALIAPLSIGIMLSAWYLAKETKKANVTFRFDFSSEEVRLLWKFSLPAVLSAAMLAPVTWMCNTILVNQLDGYAEMGVFNAANQWRTAILFVPQMASSILLPILSSLHGLGDSVSHRKIVLTSIALNVLAAGVVALPIIILARPIMSSYGGGFQTGQTVLIIVSASSVIASINNVIGQSIISAGRMWFGFISNVAWGSICVGLTYLLFRADGAYGLALAYLISNAFVAVAQMVLLQWQGWSR